MKKLASISTPEFFHTGEGALVEIYMLRKHGTLPPTPWKHDDLRKKWSDAIGILKTLKRNRGVSNNELLSYILDCPNFDLTWDKIGLLHYFIDTKGLGPVNLEAYVERFIKDNPNQDHNQALTQKNMQEVAAKTSKKKGNVRSFIKRKSNGRQ